jgi:hypothetical protein
MLRRLLVVLGGLGPFGLLACGSPSEPPKAPEATPWIAPTPMAPRPSKPKPRPPYEPPATAAPIATQGAPPPAAASDYEITFNDCNKLVANYEKVLRQDEMIKLDAKKLAPKAYGPAKEQVEQVVQQGVEGWRAQCQSIVGTAQVKTRIQCAVGAGELARFNGCWDGQFDHE